MCLMNVRSLRSLQHSWTDRQQHKYRKSKCLFFQISIKVLDPHQSGALWLLAECNRGERGGSPTQSSHRQHPLQQWKAQAKSFLIDHNTAHVNCCAVDCQHTLD